jgi:L-rhamnose mutarotase
MADYPKHFCGERDYEANLFLCCRLIRTGSTNTNAGTAAFGQEMLDALHETGWQNYSLFLREDGLLVGYLETEDFERARAGMSGRDVNERWQREMKEFFVQPAALLPDRVMQPLEEVFHL